MSQVTKERIGAAWLAVELGGVLSEEETACAVVQAEGLQVGLARLPGGVWVAGTVSGESCRTYRMQEEPGESLRLVARRLARRVQS
jgi:hypothetical protein